MPVSELLADDLADLEELTLEDLLQPEQSTVDDINAILCSCCCSSCGC
jgi:hypothetical protein